LNRTTCRNHQSAGNPPVRVLIVAAAPFRASTGTGTTLSNLFAGWPPGLLAEVYLTGQERVGQTYGGYFYSPRNIPIDYYARRVLERCGRSLVQGAPAIGAIPSGEAERSPRAASHREFRAMADLCPPRIPPSLRDWLRSYGPDVIYSPLGSVRIMKLTARIARQCRRPIVPHFMDDWPGTLYSSGELVGRARKAVNSSLQDVIGLSNAGICISQPMAEEYRARYGLPFTVFGNCVDEAAFRDPRDFASKISPRARTLRLVYVGGLHLDRWRSLMDIGRALEHFRVGGPKALLTVYAPEGDIAKYGQALLRSSTVQVVGSIAGREVSKVLIDADLLVHVESFDQRIGRYTRLSVSTKIPQYMAAGRPIFAYGPSNLASMRHIAAAKAGIVAGERDSRLLAALLKSVCSNIAEYGRLGHNGYVYATKHHRQGMIATEFADFLRAAATDSLQARSMSDTAVDATRRTGAGRSLPGSTHLDRTIE
jgi:glycosyltransferase involved in cell wall biosynthesis